MMIARLTLPFALSEIERQHKWWSPRWAKLLQSRSFHPQVSETDKDGTWRTWQVQRGKVRKRNRGRGRAAPGRHRFTVTRPITASRSGRDWMPPTVTLRVVRLPDAGWSEEGRGGAPPIFFTASSPAMADQPIPTSRRASSSRRV